MLQVRIHKNIRTRAELLLEWVAGNAELSPSGSAELTDVYRIAVSLGLERLESKRRRELNENPDPPEELVENPDPSEDLVENPDPLEDEDEEVDPIQGLSAFQKQIYAEFIDKQKKVINIAPKGQPEKLIDAELGRAVYRVLYGSPEKPETPILRESSSRMHHDK
jgi:hypothetical protein